MILGPAAVLAAVILVPLGAVLWMAGSPSMGPGDWAAVRFTLIQAALSAALSVGLAVPLARALSRRDFPGRAAIVTLLGAPFILPVIVAVLGLVAVFGRGGWANAALGTLGLPPVSIYGLQGVVAAHVFFNLPLCTRLILQGWQSVPAERFRLAASLGASPRDISRLIERPMLREVAPGAFALVFLLCLSSFAVALTLGGGPRATTVELAIYQAFVFEFDVPRAATLAAIQLILAGAAVAIALRIGLPGAESAGWGRPALRYDLRAWDMPVIALAATLIALPLTAVALRGVPSLLDLPPQVWSAALRSVLVALASAALCLALALPLALGLARRGSGWAEGLGTVTIAVSPLVIGTGAFVLLFPIVDPRAVALPVTATVNAVMALPFALRALLPEARRTERIHGRLAASLGMRGLARLRLLDLPRLRRPLGFSAGLAAALSMGDLGVIALFADAERATLPLQLYRLMGAYRMDEAMGAAVLLLALSLALFWLFDRGGRLAEA